jgi:hypothetical protein
VAGELAPGSSWSESAPEPIPQPRPQPTASVVTTVTTTEVVKAKPAFDPAVVVSAVRSVEPRATVAAVVVDRATGKPELELNADRPFRSASLVKLLIAIDLLERGAGPADRQRIARMLTMSDDGLASMFWVRAGGPALVTRTSAKLGLTGVRPPEVPGQWGEVVVTPRDIVTVYRYVLGLPPEDRRLIVDALAQAPRVAADGFDQHFGIPDGIDADWAVKQGWGSDDRAKVLHSTGLVGLHWRYVVVLLSEHPLGTGWQTCARSVTAAARAMDGTLPGI